LSTENHLIFVKLVRGAEPMEKRHGASFFSASLTFAI